MRLNTLQIVAALGAAIAFILAFMAAGAALVAFLFALVGAGLLAWVVYGLARSALTRKGDVSHARHPAVPPPSA